MSNAKCFIGDSGVDQVIRNYGRLEGVIDFCRDNGLAIDEVEVAPVDRLINDALKQTLVDIHPLFAQKPVKKQAKVFVFPDQNTVDLALQETGSVEGLISFLRGNGYAPNDNPTIGHLVVTASGNIVDQSIREFYKGIEYTVCTGLVLDAHEESLTVDSTEVTVDSTEITVDETII